MFWSLRCEWDGVLGALFEEVVSKFSFMDLWLRWVGFHWTWLDPSKEVLWANQSTSLSAEED